ncbi:hypothetical protein MNQ08_003796, partial [Salmonella enterica]|nr:hypothetical protein [Salmonella enterica]
MTNVIEKNQLNEDSRRISEEIDSIRRNYNTKLDEKTRGEKGQFMTPSGIAHLLASMFDNLDGEQRILDAGAGVGSLTAALVERAINEFSPQTIDTEFWEIEPILVKGLKETIHLLN